MQATNGVELLTVIIMISAAYGVAKLHITSANFVDILCRVSVRLINEIQRTYLTLFGAVRVILQKKREEIQRCTARTAMCQALTLAAHRTAYFTPKTADCSTLAACDR